MMVFGVDPHKQSHTAAAADELGRRQAHKTVKARQEGHRELIAWARDLAPDSRRWAVEDVRHVASGLVRELLAAGEEVVFVPTRLMAGTRSGGRERGKSDPIDALANARAALREDVYLPAARLNGQVLDVRRLSDHRDDLVAERTRMINRLRWLVHDLEPALAPAPRTLSRTRKARRQLETGLRALPSGPAAASPCPCSPRSPPPPTRSPAWTKTCPPWPAGCARNCSRSAGSAPPAPIPTGAMPAFPTVRASRASCSWRSANPAHPEPPDEHNGSPDWKITIYGWSTTAGDFPTTICMTA